MQRTQIYLTPAQHEYLTKRAQENKTSISDEIRKTIDADRQSKQVDYQVEPTATAGQSLLKLSDNLSKASYQATDSNNAPTDFDQYLLDDYERIKNYYR